MSDAEPHVARSRRRKSSLEKRFHPIPHQTRDNSASFTLPLGVPISSAGCVCTVTPAKPAGHEEFSANERRSTRLGEQCDRAVLRISTCGNS
eukprot:scaffold8094_cov376-Prasinococcus_capsulatus_cf.AAC.2